MKEAAKLAAQKKIEVPTVSAVVVQEEIVSEDAVFTDAQLEDALLELIEKYKSENKSLEITVLKQSWTLLDGKNICFSLYGEIQEDVFNKFKPDAIAFLRNKIGNSKIQLSYELKEEEHDDRPKLYTSTDKFNYLMSKHPALSTFKSKFGLETDF